MPNNNLSLSVLSSHCWIDDSSEISKNSNDKLVKGADFEPISLKQIPPIKRRRLNGLSKMAMHSSLACLDKANVDPKEVITVFASQHGELNRTISIIKTMLEEKEVSPKDFSLSVHNSALGLFSIFNQNKAPGTSVAAATNTFGYGLLESYNYLKRFPDCKVLLTCFDLQVSDPFSKLQDSVFPSHSCSLLLSAESESVNNDSSKLSFNFKKLPKKSPLSLPLELAFFNDWHSDTSKFVLQSQDTVWEFEKDAV